MLSPMACSRSRFRRLNVQLYDPTRMAFPELIREASGRRSMYEVAVSTPRDRAMGSHRRTASLEGMTLLWCLATNTKVGERTRLVSYQTLFHAGFGDVGVANGAKHGPRESIVEMWGSTAAMYTYRMSPPLGSRSFSFIILLRLLIVKPRLADN